MQTGRREDPILRLPKDRPAGWRDEPAIAHRPPRRLQADVLVPSVGSSIAAVPVVLLALVQLGIGPAVLATAGFMTVNFILDNVIETRLMGQKLCSSTLVVFLSLVFWGSLFGPIGMVLCIPLTMTLKYACENNASARWIAVLLGPEVPLDSNQPGDERREPDDDRAL